MTEVKIPVDRVHDVTIEIEIDHMISEQALIELIVDRETTLNELMRDIVIEAIKDDNFHIVGVIDNGHIPELDNPHEE